MKKKVLIGLLMVPALAFSADYEAKSSINLGKFMSIPGAPTTVSAEIYNEVTNNTATAIWVRVHYNLFVEGCGDDVHSWNVKVNPFGTWKDHWKPSKECRFSHGDYSVAAQGAIEGIDKSLHAETWSYSSVNVR